MHINTKATTCKFGTFRANVCVSLLTYPPVRSASVLIIRPELYSNILIVVKTKFVGGATDIRPVSGTGTRGIYLHPVDEQLQKGSAWDKPSILMAKT